MRDIIKIFNEIYIILLNNNPYLLSYECQVAQWDSLLFLQATSFVSLQTSSFSVISG